MKRFVKSIVVFLLSISSPIIALADGPLRSIIIFGNEKTERITILGIINVEAQTYINDKTIKEVDDRLTNAGLFKTVHVFKLDNPDGSCDLRITVVEKQLWFVFPMFQAGSGRYNGGAAFGESNILASNARTLFLAQGGNSLNRLLAIFDAKNIFDSNVTMRTWTTLRSDQVPLYNGSTQVGEIKMKDAFISVVPGYQWTPEIRSSFLINYRYVDYGIQPLVPLSGRKGNDVSLGFEFMHDSLRRRDGLVQGTRFKAAYEFSDPRLGSDFIYHIEELQGTYAMRFLNRLNYIISAQGAITNTGVPFHHDLTLGGSGLRGYSDRQFRGDTMIVTHQDLLYPAYRHPRFTILGLVFHDMGLLYRDANGLKRGNLRNGIGAGLRVSLADILAPVFGLDVGYGVETKAFHLYFALGLVDF